MKDQILSTKEASRILSLSVNTLKQYRSSGDGPDFIKDKEGKFLGYFEENLIQYEKDKETKRLNKKGKPIYLQIQDKLTKELKYTLHKNTFSNEIIINNQRLDDNLLSYILVELSKTGIICTNQELITAITHYTYRRSCHPVLEKLKTFKWDGVERLETWLAEHSSEQDSAYLREVSKLILIAAIRRIKNPGCKYELMPIFEGPQGNGKSTLIQMLSISDKWYGSDCPLHRSSKEVIEACSGKWIVEVSELSSFKRSDAENLKSQLSKQVDEARLAYGRLTVQNPRQFILIGTTNKTRYLIDETGNRRFLPIKIDKEVNLEVFKKIIPQLWAEALIKEQSYGDLWLDKTLWQEAKERCNLRLLKDAWSDKIAMWLPSSMDGYISLQSLLNRLEIPSSQITPWTGERIIGIMQQLGYSRHEKNLTGEIKNTLTVFCDPANVNLSDEISLGV